MKNPILKIYQNAIYITKTCKDQRDAFRYWMNRNAKAPYESLAFDTETTGLSFGVPSMLHLNNKTDILMNDVTVFGISLAIPTKHNLILIWARLGTDLFEEAKKILLVKGPKVAHNARYDLRALQSSHIKVADRKNIHCTLTAARIYWNRRQRFGLQPLCEMLCPELSDWEIPVKAEIRKIKSRYTRSGHPKNYANYSFIPEEVMSKYAAVDAFMCFMIHTKIHRHMQTIYKEVYTRELKVMHLALKMENHGLQYDLHKSLKNEKLLTKNALQLENKLYEIAGTEFNPKSPAQVLETLLDLKIPEEHLTLNKKLSTDKNLLEAIIDNKNCNKKGLRFISTLLDMRALHKLLNSYLIPLRARAKFNNGRIYCNINTADTKTGRMAVTDPGLQTIPRLISKRKRKNPIRSCFICRPGYYNYYFDYAQIEMIFYAALINEERIIKAYNNGEDIYTVIAGFALSKKNLSYIRKHLGDPRQQLKGLSLAVIYGAGIPGTAKILQMSRTRASSLLADYLDACPAVLEYREQCINELHKQGYVEDFFGRRYHVEPRQAYKAPNAVVQGSCAQILKIAFLQVSAYLKRKRELAKVIMPIHDELQFERPAAKIKTEMIFIRNIIKQMRDIPQLIERGIFLRIDAAKSTTNWESKKDIII